MKTVAWIPRFASPDVASTRIRCLNIIRELNRLGHRSEIFEPARFDSYGTLIFVKAYGKEHIDLARQAQKLGRRVVFDLCDNHFLVANTCRSERDRVRSLVEMIALSDRVVVSTEALRKVVGEHVPSVEQKISVIGDAVEETLPPSRFPSRIAEWVALFFLRLFIGYQARLGRTPIVWFGIHGGKNADYGMQDILKVADQLNAVASSHGISLTVISNSFRKFLSVSKAFEFPSFYVPWGGSSFFSALSKHRIAIVPIRRNEFTECKSNNRVALAITRGLGVVVPELIPAYEELLPYIKHTDIKTGIAEYIDKPNDAKNELNAGRAYIARNFSLRAIGQKWEWLLMELEGNRLIKSK
ncbi:MAG: hypothetical protein AB1482_02435 [Pseudomonadota bacterium]